MTLDQVECVILNQFKAIILEKDKIINQLYKLTAVCRRPDVAARWCSPLIGRKTECTTIIGCWMSLHFIWNRVTRIYYQFHQVIILPIKSLLIYWSVLIYQFINLFINLSIVWLNSLGNIKIFCVERRQCLGIYWK